MSVLFDEDPDVARALELEDQRQRDCIVLIASENYASKAVLEPGASVISNKYAEGYPGRRYYGGCEYSDVVETLAVDRVKELFGAQHANVQPHSGAQANMAAYFAVLEPGDTVLGMQQIMEDTLPMELASIFRARYTISCLMASAKILKLLITTRSTVWRRNISLN